MRYVVIVLIVAMFYLFWINGLLTMQNKYASLFVGSFARKNLSKATFLSCTGNTKRVIKFEKDGIYTFDSSFRIKKGSVSAFLYTKDKNILFEFNEQNLTQQIEIFKNKRYYLVVKFYKADGDYQITWKQF